MIGSWTIRRFLLGMSGSDLHIMQEHGVRVGYGDPDV